MHALLALAAPLIALGPAPAQPVAPKAGSYAGTITVQTTGKPRRYPLAFTVSGNGRRIFAFDAPPCRGNLFGDRLTLTPKRVLRPRVSRSGSFATKLDYTKETARWSLSASGRFTSSTRARGSVSATAKLLADGAEDFQCQATGTWSAARRGD